MYILGLNIEIDGKYVFTSIQDVNIEKSIDTIGSKATIKLPASARLRSNGKLQSNSVQTAILFKRGMSVVIKLAYNEAFIEEFTGFITSVGAGSPTIIECEGKEYLLRSKVESKTFRDTTLADVVNYVVAGKLSLNNDIPVVDVKSFVIKAGVTALQVLDKLKEIYLLTINIDGDKIFVGLREQQRLGDVKYSLNGENRNIVSDSELKFRTEEEKKFKVKAVVFSKDNTKKTYDFGDADGEQKTFHFYDTKTNPEELVKSELKRIKYTGFEGKIETMLLPYAKPAMVSNITDNTYTERTGNYYIISTVVEVSTSGAIRIVELGNKVSNG